MKMIGITGTNGKTTTAFLTAGILQEAGYRVGMIGTIESYDGRRRETVKTPRRNRARSTGFCPAWWKMNVTAV